MNPHVLVVAKAPEPGRVKTRLGAEIGMRRAAELGRLRGTHAGVELALKLNFPDLPLRIEDGGSVAWSTDGQLPKPSAPAFVVYCDSPISQNEAATVARVIESIKPAHVSYRLRVKGPRKREGES